MLFEASVTLCSEGGGNTFRVTSLDLQNTWRHVPEYEQVRRYRHKASRVDCVQSMEHCRFIHAGRWQTFSVHRASRHRVAAVCRTL